MTQLRREINQELADKLLVKDASNWALFKAIHKSRIITMCECFILALAVGYILGVSL